MTSATPVRFFALLVGIDHFLAQPQLDGCVADAEQMRAWLIDGLGVEPDHIVLLTNEAATRE
ncbi:MAG: caspase family protein, partial [Myxococcales bacterium]|nr:caspase family protein [Myxococcales bacterium]